MPLCMGGDAAWHALCLFLGLLQGHYAMATFALTCGMCAATASLSNCMTRCAGQSLSHTYVLLSFFQEEVCSPLVLPSVFNEKKSLVRYVAP